MINFKIGQEKQWTQDRGPTDVLEIYTLYSTLYSYLYFIGTSVSSLAWPIDGMHTLILEQKISIKCKQCKTQ